MNEAVYQSNQHHEGNRGDVIECFGWGRGCRWHAVLDGQIRKTSLKKQLEK